MRRLSEGKLVQESPMEARLREFKAQQAVGGDQTVPKAAGCAAPEYDGDSTIADFWCGWAPAEGQLAQTVRKLLVQPNIGHRWLEQHRERSDGAAREAREPRRTQPQRHRVQVHGACIVPIREEEGCPGAQSVADTGR